MLHSFDAIVNGRHVFDISDIDQRSNHGTVLNTLTNRRLPGDTLMFPMLPKFTRVTRAMLSLAATASMIVSAHPAAIHAATPKPVPVQSSPQNLELRVSQAVL